MDPGWKKQGSVLFVKLSFSGLLWAGCVQHWKFCDSETSSQPFSWWLSHVHNRCTPDTVYLVDSPTNSLGINQYSSWETHNCKMHFCLGQSVLAKEPPLEKNFSNTSSYDHRNCNRFSTGADARAGCQSWVKSDTRSEPAHVSTAGSRTLYVTNMWPESLVFLCFQVCGCQTSRGQIPTSELLC